MKHHTDRASDLSCVEQPNLFGVDVEDFGGGSRCYRHESAGIHFAVVHTFLPYDGHSVLNSVNSVRNLPEVFLPQRLLFSVKRTVICACTLQISTSETRNTSHKYIV